MGFKSGICKKNMALVLNQMGNILGETLGRVFIRSGTNCNLEIGVISKLSVNISSKTTHDFSVCRRNCIYVGRYVCSKWKE